MENIKIHLITEIDTLKSISHQYNCPLETIYLLNPLVKYQDLKIGQILYVIEKERNIVLPFDLSTIKDNLNKINDLNKKSFTSYVNKFNDYILIENELSNNYRNLSNKILKEENDQTILNNQLKLLHSYYINFTDNLIKKDEKEIIETKNKIKNHLLSLYKYLDSKNIKIDFKKITSYVENRLLMIIKIVNGNYYDLYNKS